MSSAVLLDRDFHVWLAKDPSSKKLRVVLSPSFYIAKTSPVKFESLKKAQKAAASVFEESLPQGEFVFETHLGKEDGFIFLAVDAQTALKNVQSVTKAYKKIELYTAQSVFKNQTFPLLLKEGRNLISLDGVVLNSFLDVDGGAKIDGSKLEFSKKLDFFKSSKLSGKAAKTLSASIVFLTAVLALDAGSRFYAGHKAKESIESQKAAKNLPDTNMQMESAIKSLAKTDKEQTNARVFIKKLLSFGFTEDENIKNLKIEKNGYEVEINTKRAEEIKKYIAERFRIEGSVASENSLYLKVSL